MSIRGPDAAAGYSGKIICRVDGSLTRNDITEILAQTGHKAYVRSRKGGRCLTVHDGGHGLPDQLLDQAIEMALQKIQLDAIAKRRKWEAPPSPWPKGRAAAAGSGDRPCWATSFPVLRPDGGSVHTSGGSYTSTTVPSNECLE